MTILITSLVALIFCLPALAEPITAGCTLGTYDCYPGPNDQPKCSWGYDLGVLKEIELTKTGSGPSYEIYQGQISGVTRLGNAYRFSIYQRREATKRINNLKVELDVNGITIISNGENITEARYFDAPKKFGVGWRCSTDIEEAP